MKWLMEVLIPRLMWVPIMAVAAWLFYLKTRSDIKRAFAANRVMSPAAFRISRIAAIVLSVLSVLYFILLYVGTVLAD